MYYICISSYIRLQMKKANVLAILAYEKRFLGNLSLCCDLLSFLVSLCCKEQLTEVPEPPVERCDLLSFLVSLCCKEQHSPISSKETSCCDLLSFLVSLCCKEQHGLQTNPINIRCDLLSFLVSLCCKEQQRCLRYGFIWVVICFHF